MKNKINNLIGNTPIYHYNESIFIKMESYNIGSSIKDRVASHIIHMAENSGKIKEGGTIVEYTSGNLGISISIQAASKGYRFICIASPRTCQDKLKLIKSMNADIILFDHHRNKNRSTNIMSFSKKLAANIKNSYFVNQFENTFNPDAHEKYTAPEIFNQLKNIEAIFICIGSGGTITGIGRFFKKNSPSTKIIGVSSIASIVSQKFYNNPNKPIPTLIEGIADDFITPIIDLSVIDDIVEVSDKEAIKEYIEIQQNGLSFGITTGMLLSAVKKRKIQGNILIISGDSKKKPSVNYGDVKCRKINIESCNNSYLNINDIKNSMNEYDIEIY